VLEVGEVTEQITVTGETPLLDRADASVASLIGRDTSSALCIADLALSRNHCVVERGGESTVVRDLDSRNGTLVNGVPIRTHALTDGDQIRAGDSAFLYVAAAGVTDSAEVRSLSSADLVEHSTVVRLPHRKDDPASTSLRLSADVTIRHAVIGESAVMQEMYRRIARVAQLTPPS
jgi:hypothetical protein